MKAYVTGIAGFIGSHVAEHLLEQGVQVHGCDDLSTGREENVPEGAQWARRRVETVPSVSADVIVHLAAVACARYPTPLELWKRNVGATVHALALARRAGARFVLASTAAAHRGATGDYGASKYACERLALAQAAAVLRYANVWGPRQRDDVAEPGVLAAWQRAMRLGVPLRVDGDGSQTRDFIHVDDVARATVLAAVHRAGDGEVIDICTGIQTSIAELADRLAWPTVRGERHPDDPDAIEQDPGVAETLLGFHADARLQARDLTRWGGAERRQVTL